MDEGELMTVREIAGYLRVHELTVYRWLNNGKLPGFRVGSSWRSKRSVLEKFFEDKTRVQS